VSAQVAEREEALRQTVRESLRLERQRFERRRRLALAGDARNYDGAHPAGAHPSDMHVSGGARDTDMGRPVVQAVGRSPRSARPV